MKKLVLILALGTLSAMAAVTSNFTVTSDYVFRGLSQTADQGPAVQGGLDYSHDSGLAMGTWLSNTTAAWGVEADLYGGYTFKVNEDLSIGLKYIYYHYTRYSTGSESEYNFNISSVVNFNFYYADEWFGVESSYMYFNLAKSFEVAKDLSVGLSVGYLMLDKEEVADYKNFVDYKISLDKKVGETYTVGVFYTDTTAKNFADVDYRTDVVGVQATFTN